ncbi:MAG: TMEM175 family protein [Candidatus Tumulicola sp.]
MPLIYNEIAGRNVDRLAALSDGVFAFAMTLLVHDLRVPVIRLVGSEHDLLRALAALAPNLLTYLISFMTLGIFWVGQQTQLNKVERADREFAWIHLTFLLAVTLVPFTTQLLAAFIEYRTALLVYWLNILGLGATLWWSWQYVRRAGLLKSDAPAGIDAAVRRRIAVAQRCTHSARYCACGTYLSIAFILLVQLNYVFAPRIGVLRRL